MEFNGNKYKLGFLAPKTVAQERNFRNNTEELGGFMDPRSLSECPLWRVVDQLGCIYERWAEK